MRIAAWTPSVHRPHDRWRTRSRSRCILFFSLEIAGHASGNGLASGEAASAIFIEPEARSATHRRSLVVDDADAVQVKCPDPIVPPHYQVNQESWTFLDTYTMQSDDQALGSVVRNALSLAGEYRLFDNSSRLWATVERAMDGLHFSDCAGNRIATFETTTAGGIFGTPLPEFSIATANGEVVGKTSLPTGSSASLQGTGMNVEDTGGNIFARIQQTSRFPWPGTLTQLLVIDPDAAESDANSIDQRTDPRVLTLLVASRLGSQSSALRPAGPIWEIMLAIGMVVSLGGCIYACVRHRCRRKSCRRSGTCLESGGLLGGDEAYSDDDEDVKRSGGLLFCCSKAPRHFGGNSPQQARPYSSPFF